MRLLHTDTLELHYFPRDAPPYAILSHTWETEELSLQEIGPKSKGTRGYKKIAMAAATARADNLDYIWVDTCCIDKTSSAELSEAINSMFQWYQNASVCYAYLFDVVPNHHDSVASINPRVRESKWFTRGWTLQELIAPSDVIFYAQDWTELGTKSSLRTVISQITRIPELVLLGKSIKDYSIAQRMSWASQRKTTRTEDMAYCLMGLFEITMPMLYGEGMQAFIRLQEEIMKKSDDQTLFAWTSAALSVQYRFGCGLLAPVPRFFETCAGIVRGSKLPWKLTEKTTFAMTNKGLSIRLPVLARKPPIPYPGSIKGTYLALLNCHDVEDETKALALWLGRSDESPKHYFRWRAEETITVDISWTLKRLTRLHELYVQQQNSFSSSMVHLERRPDSHMCRINMAGLRETDFSISANFPEYLARNGMDFLVLDNAQYNFEDRSGHAFALLLKSYPNSVQACLIRGKRNSLPDFSKSTPENNYSNRCLEYFAEKDVWIRMKIKRELTWLNHQPIHVVYLDTSGTSSSSLNG